MIPDANVVVCVQARPGRVRGSEGWRPPSDTEGEADVISGGTAKTGKTLHHHLLLFLMLHLFIKHN